MVACAAGEGRRERIVVWKSITKRAVRVEFIGGAIFVDLVVCLIT